MRNIDDYKFVPPTEDTRDEDAQRMNDAIENARKQGSQPQQTQPPTPAKRGPKPKNGAERPANQPTLEFMFARVAAHKLSESTVKDEE